MTEMLREGVLAQVVLKGGGAMFVGFCVAGAASPARLRPPTARSQQRPLRPQAVDTFIAIHADNTATIKSGRVELGQGSTDRAADDRGRGARHGHEPAQVRPSRHERDAGHRRHVRQQLDHDAGPRVRSAAATARQALLGIAATQLGVPVASLSVSKGVVSGGGKTVTYGQLIGDKLFNVDDGGAEHQPRCRRQRSRSARTSSSGSPGAAGRHPGQGRPGKYTYVHNVRVPGCCTAGSSGRAARARTATDARDRLGRRELDQAHPGRAGRPPGRLPRRRRAARVRRDPGGGQLKVMWDDPPALPAAATSSRRCGPSTAPAGAGADRGNTGNVDSALRLGGEDGVRELQYQLQRAHADWPVLLASPT